MRNQRGVMSYADYCLVRFGNVSLSHVYSAIAARGEREW